MNKLVLILLAIFLPPVAVAVKRGVGKDLLINILLCLLVFFPGMVHALWIVLNRRRLKSLVTALPQTPHLEQHFTGD